MNMATPHRSCILGLNTIRENGKTNLQRPRRSRQGAYGHLDALNTVKVLVRLGNFAGSVSRDVADVPSGCTPQFLCLWLLEGVERDLEPRHKCLQGKTCCRYIVVSKGAEELHQGLRLTLVSGRKKK